MRDYEKILSDLRLKSILVQSGMADPLYLDAADTIEELLGEKTKLENSGKLLVAAFDLAKEKLQKYRHAAFIISETCVEESKGHITANEAVKKIRETIYYSRQMSLPEPPKEVE